MGKERDKGEAFNDQEGDEVFGACEEGKGEETSEDIDLLPKEDLRQYGRNLQSQVHLFTHFRKSP